MNSNKIEAEMLYKLKQDRMWKMIEIHVEGFYLCFVIFNNESRLLKYRIILETVNNILAEIRI